MYTIPKNTDYTFIVSFGTTKTSKTVQYRILDSDLNVLVAFTDTAVQELGNGQYGVKLTFATEFTGYIQWKNVTDNIVVADAITIVSDFITNIQNILLVETGRWKIIGTQMIFYAADGTTPLYTFNLKDSTGALSSSNPFERVPV